MIIEVVLLATAVGIGVHVLHKEALAQTFQIIVWAEINGEYVKSAKEPVIFRFQDGSQWEKFERETNAFGIATVVRDGDGYEDWQAEWTQNGDWGLRVLPNPAYPSTCSHEFYIGIEQG